MTRKLPEHPLPPPSEPPMADHAPEKLTMFLYMVQRDLLPARYVESVISFIESDRQTHVDNDMWAYCEKIARRLCYEPPEVRS